MFFDPASKNGFVYIISGLGDDPTKNLSSFSAISWWEAEIVQALMLVVNS
jgi:hypothetical protein